jgi:hypothetical protein
VGFTTDRRGLILSVKRGAKSGGFLVDVDDEILGAVDEARARIEEEAAEAEAAAKPRPDRADRPQSSLAVREIQARLRQGQSIEKVAAQAGVDVAWIERFAAPVRTEMAEVIRTVRTLRYFKQRIGTSGASLGDSVYRNLVERGVTTPRDDLDRAWSARQLADGQWEVRFDYVSRGRPVSVSWAYDEETGKVVGRDRLAGQLAFRPGGPPPAKRAKAAGTAAGAAAVAEAAAEDPPRPAASKASAKKVAAARKAARARMVAEAERATRRNVAVAKKAAKRKPRPRPAPPAEVDVEIEVDEIEAVEALDEPVVSDAGADHDDEELDGEDDLDVDIIDDVDDEEAVTPTRRRPLVPARQRPPAARIFDTDEGDADNEAEPELDLEWLHDDDFAPTAVQPPEAPAGAASGDGATERPKVRLRRREPLRAVRPDPDPAPRERLRHASGAEAPRVPSSPGPAPVFRTDLAQRAGREPAPPERDAAAPPPSRRRPLRGS